MIAMSQQDLSVNIIQAHTGAFSHMVHTPNLVVASAMSAAAASFGSAEFHELTLLPSASAASEVAEGTLKFDRGTLYVSSEERWVPLGPLHAGEGIVLTTTDSGITISAQNTITGNHLMASHEFIVRDPHSTKAWRMRCDGDDLIFEFGSAEGSEFAWQRAAFQVTRTS